jgi:DNA-directed RNA polymerase subunit RPC12/RpoP
MSTTRTDLACTNCPKTFVAELDLSIDGDHVIVCPYCSHKHFRQVKGGQVTGIRWSSDREHDAVYCVVWKSGELGIKTSVVSSYIREAWLNRSDIQL